jgi:hypothetical protein
MEPEWQRNKHNELFYPFGEAGHRARDFYGDPYVSGPYALSVPVNTGLPVIGGVPINTAPPVIGP